MSTDIITTDLKSWLVIVWPRLEHNDWPDRRSSVIKRYLVA